MIHNNIEIVLGDITKISVDAIVNAANTSLLGGGGVDGAIHKAGGKALTEECEKIRNKQGGCKEGRAVITTAGNLPAKYVIHTVGPVWNGGTHNEENLLVQVYISCLELALEHQVATISFPNISTGRYRFPKEKAAQIALHTIAHFLRKTDKIKQVKMVCFDQENYDIYTNIHKI